MMESRPVLWVRNGVRLRKRNTSKYNDRELYKHGYRCYSIYHTERNKSIAGWVVLGGSTDTVCPKH